MSEKDQKASSSNEDTVPKKEDVEVEATDWPVPESTPGSTPGPDEPEPSATDWPDPRVKQPNRGVTWPEEQDQDTWEDSAVDP